MDETLIRNGYNLIETRDILKMSLDDLIESKKSNHDSTQIIVPKRLYDDLIKLFESHIDDINKEISEL